MADETEIISLKVSTDDAGKRLDAFLPAHIEGWSRARLARLIEEGDVLVNGSESKPSYKLRANDEIEVELTEIDPPSFEPENIPLDIVYEDEFLAVINKPAGMIVHPGAGVSSGTLANALAFHFGSRIADRGFEENDEQSIVRSPQSAIRNRLGLVHRLDKDTSGLIVVGKSEEITEALSRQFHDREVFKSYVALVHGSMREDQGKIDRPIARERFNRTKMTVAAAGRHALSLWKVRERFDKFTLVDVEIKTGRTHQIRVHLASINYPVVGDETYNAGRDKTVADPTIKKAIHDLNRFFLHAERLAFTHPTSGERLEFRMELPAELIKFLDILRHKSDQ